jgi:hypothetical protein
MKKSFPDGKLFFYSRGFAAIHAEGNSWPQGRFMRAAQFIFRRL